MVKIVKFALEVAGTGSGNVPEYWKSIWKLNLAKLGRKIVNFKGKICFLRDNFSPEEKPVFGDVVSLSEVTVATSRRKSFNLKLENHLCSE